MAIFDSIFYLVPMSGYAVRQNVAGRFEILSGTCDVLECVHDGYYID